MPAGRHGDGGAFYRDWRLTAIDGTTFDLPDTKSNVDAFGRPPSVGTGRVERGYPQIRMVDLVECGTQAAFAPGSLAHAVKPTLAELLQRLLPLRRHRSNPRAIKRKVAGWPLKRAHHYETDDPPDLVFTIVAATKPKRVRRTRRS